MAKTKKTTRSTLAQAAALGQENAGKAKFTGWTKLPGTSRVMAGRFDDGTIVYRGKDEVWVFGKPAKAG